MPSTHLSLHFHIVFSTKNRAPLIAPEWRDRLHDYIGGTINSLDATAQGVGGTADHIHILVGLRATHRLSDFVRELKKSTSSWVHTELDLRSFAWQEGYGAFTVSPSARPQVQAYIANQERHHHTRSFLEEYAEFLQQAKIDFDPNHLA